MEITIKYQYKHIESTDSVPNEIIDSVIPNETPNRPNIIKNYQKVNNFITICNSDKSYITNICLEIINYWLNNEVRTSPNEENKSQFNWYKQFMQNYDKIKTYEPKIYYIENKLFQKKKDLYELYDKYDNLLVILDPSNDSQCADLSSIVNKYNIIVEQYLKEDNSNLPEVLRNFRSKFEIRLSESISKCGVKILPFKSFVHKPVFRTDGTDYSQEITRGVGDFLAQPFGNLASSFTITLFGTSVGITAFIYRLRSKKNENITMLNNIDEDMHEFHADTSEEHEWDSQESTYNVTYLSK
ncbi:PIR Superfamily Protein [Plasmodium ovale wallikeri]|uniref:PIR Superfamily Protein n=1 Tax=Plasmodium ovale wallikeri TaxID=864142 RepID=A0A1A9APE3_PLAOA|nr:PIR Superfamily Protein [Plasmodium ovale wallikeri]